MKRRFLFCTILTILCILFINTSYGQAEKVEVRINTPNGEKTTVTIHEGDYTDPESATQATFEMLDGNNEKALNLINRAIEEQPQNPRLYNTRASIYQNLKLYDKAIEDFNKAIKISPDYATPYYNLGNLFRDLGQYQNALTYYKLYLIANPLDGDGYTNMGFVKLENLDDIQGAMADFTAAIDLEQTQNKEEEGPYYGRSVCHFENKNYSKAIQDATSAIKYMAVNPDAYLIRAKSYLRLNNKTAGMRDLKTAIEQYLNQNNYDAANEATVLYKQLGGQF